MQKIVERIQKLSHKHILIILAILGFTLYGSSLTNSFVGDDTEQITNNKLIHSITNIPQIFTKGTFNTGGSADPSTGYYKPILSTTYTVLYALAKGNPLPFHLFQISLHIANTFLVYYLFQKHLKKVTAIFLSTIFLIHPFNSEAVLYISALQDTLFLFWGLLALEIIGRVNENQKNNNIYLLTSLCLLLSVLSKETGILFIPIVLAYIFLFKNKKITLHTLPFILSSGILYGALRLLVNNNISLSSHIYPMQRISLIERAKNIPEMIFFYLRTFLWPQDLSISYHWQITNLSLYNFWIPLVLDSLALILLIWFGIKKLEKEYQKIYFFFVSWFMMGIIAHLQIIPLDQTVADRWFHLSMVGLLGIIGIIVESQKEFIKKYLNIIFPVLTIMLIALSSRTILRTFDWKNNFTLYSHDLHISKNNFVLENGLGYELALQKKYNEAIEHTKKSTDLYPYWFISHNNLGGLYAIKGQQNNDQESLQKAEENFKKAKELKDYYLSYQNLAKLYLYQNRLEEAKNTLEEATKKYPQNPQLHYFLSMTYDKLGKKEEALREAQKSVDLDTSPVFKNWRDTLLNKK